MKSLKGKHIVLGISGSIAAYKSMDFIRLLKKQGSEIKIIITKSAKKFITPLSLQTISSNTVLDNLFVSHTKNQISHIKLAKWADLILIAPATANLLAKLALGLADDLLCNVCLATTSPIAVAPAMNQQMYKSMATQKNLNILCKRGVLIWGPEYGHQICNDVGYGRMINIKALIKHVNQYFFEFNSLNNINIMITAGPTHESLDPIRFFTNYSSGKMGFSMAQVAANKGANVTLISGPVHLKTPLKVRRINVVTALDMQKAVMKNIQKQHIFIGCAAVSDYRSNHIYVEKIKKNKDFLKIIMIKNPDIIASIGHLTDKCPYIVGFAAETNDIQQNAQKKRIEKKIDLICANDVSLKNQGFNSNNNMLHLFWNKGSLILPTNNKKTLAQQLINKIIYLYNEKNSHKNC